MKNKPNSTDPQTEGWFNLIRDLSAPPPPAGLPSLSSVILYRCSVPTEDHWPVRIGGLALWVRGSVIQGENVTTAATMALPREGEVVLAVIPYPDSEEAVWGCPLDAEDDLDEHKEMRRKVHLRVVEAAALVDLKPFDFDVLLPGWDSFAILNCALVLNLEGSIHVNTTRILGLQDTVGQAAVVTAILDPHTKVVVRRRPDGHDNVLTWGRFPTLYQAATQAYTVPEGFWISYQPPDSPSGVITNVEATISPNGLDKHPDAC